MILFKISPVILFLMFLEVSCDDLSDVFVPGSFSSRTSQRHRYKFNHPPSVENEEKISTSIEAERIETDPVAIISKDDDLINDKALEVNGNENKNLNIKKTSRKQTQEYEKEIPVAIVYEDKINERPQEVNKYNYNHPTRAEKDYKIPVTFIYEDENTKNRNQEKNYLTTKNYSESKAPEEKRMKHSRTKGNKQRAQVITSNSVQKIDESTITEVSGIVTETVTETQENIKLKSTEEKQILEKVVYEDKEIVAPRMIAELLNQNKQIYSDRPRGFRLQKKIDETHSSDSSNKLQSLQSYEKVPITTYHPPTLNNILTSAADISAIPSKANNVQHSESGTKIAQPPQNKQNLALTSSTVKDTQVETNAKTSPQEITKSNEPELLIKKKSNSDNQNFKEISSAVGNLPINGNNKRTSSVQSTTNNNLPEAKDTEFLKEKLNSVAVSSSARNTSGELISNTIISSVQPITKINEPELKINKIIKQDSQLSKDKLKTESISNSTVELSANTKSTSVQPENNRENDQYSKDKIKIDSSDESKITNQKRRRMRDPVVPIIESTNYVYSHSGTFMYSYEGGDGTKAYSHGELKTFEDDKAGEAVAGGFSYKDKDGKDVSLTYTADEKGYRPVGDHLPTPPPIPVAIARALRYLATKTTSEPVTKALTHENSTPKIVTQSVDVSTTVMKTDIQQDITANSTVLDLTTIKTIIRQKDSELKAP